MPEEIKETPGKSKKSPQSTQISNLPTQAASPGAS